MEAFVPHVPEATQEQSYLLWYLLSQGVCCSHVDIISLALTSSTTCHLLQDRTTYFSYLFILSIIPHETTPWFMTIFCGPTLSLLTLFSPAAPSILLLSCCSFHYNLFSLWIWTFFPESTWSYVKAGTGLLAGWVKRTTWCSLGTSICLFSWHPTIENMKLNSLPFMATSANWAGKRNPSWHSSKSTEAQQPAINSYTFHVARRQEMITLSSVFLYNV